MIQKFKRLAANAAILTLLGSALAGAFGIFIASDAGNYLLVSAVHAQNAMFGPDGIIQSKLFAAGNPPTCTTCTVTKGSTSFAGSVVASGTAPVITFATVFPQVPTCLVSGEADSTGLNWSVSVSAITFVSGAINTGKINYICIGWQ